LGDYVIEVSLDDETVCTLDEDFSDMVTVLAGDHCLSITAESDYDSLDLEDDIIIEENQILKIKIVNGNIQYVLE